MTLADVAHIETFSPEELYYLEPGEFEDMDLEEWRNASIDENWHLKVWWLEDIESITICSPNYAFVHFPKGVVVLYYGEFKLKQN